MRQLVCIIKLFILLIFFFTGNIFAAEVSMNRAQTVAKNAYLEKCFYSDVVISAADVSISGSYTISDGSANVFYIFNISNKGFTIISADDDLTPVLGYSLTSVYNPANVPVQLTSLLDSYKEQISLTIQDRCINVPAEIKAEWLKYESGDIQISGTSSIEAVAPLITANWSQGCGWNQLCPSDPAGPCSHALVGCVAVAMGQVMYYHKFPQTGNGSHCYTHSAYGQLCANFGATTYNWSNMTDNTANASTATLLSHCGISVDMDYGPGGSGIPVSALNRVSNAFINYFRYNSNCTILYRANYSATTWDNMIKAELDNKRPLFYVGTGTGGHAFNVDGYQGTNYFHLNWGWAGSCNGYFYLSNLNPCGSSFSNNQAAAFNVAPTSTCQTNLVLTTNITGGTADFLAGNNITASNIISGGAKIHYGANNSVRMISGFRVYTGNSFRADLSGCSAGSFNAPAATELALSDKSVKAGSGDLKVYPNPNNGIFTIESSGDKQKQIVICDMKGKELLKTTITRSSETIRIPGTVKGIYIIKIICENEIKVGKVIVK